MSQRNHKHSVSDAVIRLTPAQYEELSIRPTSNQLDDAVAKTLEALETAGVEAEKARRFAVLLANAKGEIEQYINALKERDQQIQALERSVADSIKQVKKLEKANTKLEQDKAYMLQQSAKMKDSLRSQKKINLEQNDEILRLSRNMEADSLMDVTVGDELFNVFRIMHSNGQDFSRFLRVTQRHEGVAYHACVVQMEADGQVSQMETPMLPEAVIDRCVRYFSDNLARIAFEEC